MIGAVKGRITGLTPGRIEIETQAGFIIQALIPVSSYSRLHEGEDVLLQTVLKVKDEDVLLYGFLQASERTLFEKLISVTGVGGKIAMSCISAFSAQELVQIIQRGDVDALSSIPGIGKKTAQRIVLELTGKLELSREPAQARSPLQEDLISALVNLGYSAKSARDAINRLLKDNPQLMDFAEAFKLVLKKLGS